MTYKKATFEDQTRSYDACYYEVTLDETVLANYNPKQIHVHFSVKKEMNVYIYGGNSRYEATESIVPGNDQITVGETYSIGVDKGFLIVAYPNENVETEFGFNYWLEAEIKPVETDEEAESVPSDGSVVTGYEVVEVETIDPVVTTDEEESTNHQEPVAYEVEESESSNTQSVSAYS